MSYNPINLGNQPNDGLGDGARTGGGKINAMFHNLFSTIFIKDNRWTVTRRAYNAGVANIISWRAEDHVAGWADPSTKKRWVEGIIQNPAINLAGDNPAHLDDKNYFFITNDKRKL